MDVLPLLHPNAYSASNAAFSKAAKSVVIKTMEDAARDLHQDNNADQIEKCGVSCDGSW